MSQPQSSAETAARRSYTPLFEFSRGGMGRVELAVLRGGRFMRLYAIKRLHPHLAEDEAVRTMFLDEARVAGLIRHPNVVSVVDVGQDDQGPFLVMDFVEGVPISRLMARAAELGRLLPAQMCTALAAQAAHGLHAAHELRGPDGRPLDLVHRDVSPQNLLVGFDGLLRVTDFGVARALDNQSRTTTGMLKGKMGYMAPERLRFQPFDRRADIFALGVVVHELLAGARLYDADDAAAVARRILEEPPPDVGLTREDLPPALVELVFQCLAKTPEERPADAGLVAARFDAISTELAAAEGKLEPGVFLEEIFRDERAALAKRVNEALTDAERQQARAAAHARAGRRRAVVAIGAVGAAALGAGALLQRRRERAARAALYPIGFTWRRQQDWRPGREPSTVFGNPAPDTRGHPVWQYECTQGGDGLGGASPWYERPTRLLVWDESFFAGAAAWSRADDRNPNVTAAYLVHRLSPDEYPLAPLVRFLNPTLEPLHLEITGRLSTVSAPDTGVPVEVALARGGPLGVVGPPLFSARMAPDKEVLEVAVGDLALGPDESLVFSIRATGEAPGHVAVADTLAFTRVQPFARR